MKINLESLINTVQNNITGIETYYSICKNWYSLKETERIEYQCKAWDSESFIRDLAEILQMDSNKLYLIAKIVRKWEQKRNWEKCFPIADNYNKIIDYLKKETDEIKALDKKCYKSTGRKKLYIASNSKKL